MRSFLTYFLFLTVILASAQTRRRTYRQSEIGFFGGGAYYIGDLNNRNHFVYSDPALGVFYRLSNNYRTAFRFGLNYGKLHAEDAAHNSAYQQERALGFTSTLYEFSSLAEFNFTEYRIGNEKYWFTMYIFSGLSCFYFNTQPTGGVGPAELISVSKVQLSLPFGVGIKMNLGKRAGLTLEWGPRKTFTDYLDNVSKTYPAEGSTTAKTPPNTPGVASEGAMRGDPTMKDWYFFYGATLNFKLPGHKTCHGSERRARR